MTSDEFDYRQARDSLEVLDRYADFAQMDSANTLLAPDDLA